MKAGELLLHTLRNGLCIADWTFDQKEACPLLNWCGLCQWYADSGLCIEVALFASKTLLQSIDTPMPEKPDYSAHDDPSAQIWTSFLNEARKHDHSLARQWKGDMDSILIFAGLFSASVTAFIIESYKMLTPQPEDQTVELLARISSQLFALSNNSTITETWQMAQNTDPPSPSAIVCNTLWFLSLAFSLACALSATLVEQWVRLYLQATESRASIHERARISSYLYRGLKRFRMSEVVETIPMLLHISLLLFFAGLVEFLRPVNHAMSYLILGILIVCIALYFGATILPLFQYDCPYRTPLSAACWKIMKVFRLLKYTDINGVRRRLHGSMQACAERTALEICDKRDERDLESMSWTLKTFRQDGELEAFVSVIPQAVVGFDYSVKLLLLRLLHHKDLNVRLAHRIPRLLISCIGGAMDPTDAQKRATTCLSAIWSLSMMSVPTTFHSDISQGSIAFDEFTLRDIQAVRTALGAIGGCAVSATGVVARALLDRQLDITSMARQELCTSSRPSSCDRPSDKPALTVLGSEVLEISKRTRHNLKLLESLLKKSTAEVSSPIFMVHVNSLANEIQMLLKIARQSCSKAVHECIRNETLDVIDTFRSLLEQAGFALAIEYASTSFLSTSLPHEAFNTMRRLVLRIDFDRSFRVELQERYVKFLHEAFESKPNTGSHLPQSIVHLLLGLARALSDKTLITKARHIITRSVYAFASAGEVSNALDHLNQRLPPSDPPVLDLFTSHMYASIKLDKAPLFSGRTDAAMLHTNTEVAIPTRKYETA